MVCLIAHSVSGILALIQNNARLDVRSTIHGLFINRNNHTVRRNSLLDLSLKAISVFVKSTIGFSPAISERRAGRAYNYHPPITLIETNRINQAVFLHHSQYTALTGQHKFVIQRYSIPSFAQFFLYQKSHNIKACDLMSLELE